MPRPCDRLGDHDITSPCCCERMEPTPAQSVDDWHQCECPRCGMPFAVETYHEDGYPFYVSPTRGEWEQDRAPLVD